MYHTINTLLEKLGIGAKNRAIHIQFSHEILNSQVFLQRIDGTHHINQGVNLQLICLSNVPNIPLKQFIGSQVAVDVVTDKSQLSRITGIITQADIGSSDGSLTLYRLQVEDATALWHHRRNSRVFMNKSVIDIVQTLFQEWQSKSSLFASSLTLDQTGLSKTYDIRPFTMQSNESDHHFITRLLRSEGINWLIDEPDHIVSSIHSPIQAQQFKLIDNNAQYSRLNRQSIIQHRSSAVQAYDTISSIIAQRQLQPTAVHLQRWHPDRLEVEEGAGSVISNHQQSERHNHTSLGLEQAWHFSPAWVTDLENTQDATASSHHQVDRFNQQLSQSYALQSKQFTATSTVRDAYVGYWFTLQSQGLIDEFLHDFGRSKDTAQDIEKNNEFIITGKIFYNQNNLPKDLNQQIQALVNQSAWQPSTLAHLKHDERQANHLILQRRDVTIIPEYHPEQHKPVVHPQRAKVVGPEGEEIYVDAWGRIKVRLLFTRAEDHRHDGGAGSNDNDTDSAWVDVLTPWAGEGYGARFLPRVGEIVVIDFFDGDIDRPFVLGRIHEAERHPTQFDRTGQLPDTKSLSGIRSREIKGSGYNQLRFDDTHGQISAQLQSSHASSQLNLGQLSHPKSQATSDSRGEGFELRTDAYGAVRASKGLMFSTYDRNTASKDQLSIEETKKHLENHLNAAQGLDQIAQQHHAEPLEALNALQQFIGKLEKEDESQAEAFKEALMILATPKTLALSAQKDIQMTAEQHIIQSAQKDINMSTHQSLVANAQDKISLFAANKEAKIYTGQGKIELQAQNNGIDIFSKKDIEIASTEGVLHIVATKGITFTVGDTQFNLTPSGFSLVTNGAANYKSAQHKFAGPSPVKSVLPTFPIVDLKPNDLVLEHLHSDGKPVQGASFDVLFADGTRRTGKLDKSGKAVLKAVPQGKAVIQYGEDQGDHQFKASPNEDWFKTLKHTSSTTNN